MKSRRSATSGLFAGVELGGTKCVCTLADAEGDIHAQVILETAGPDVTLDAIAKVLGDWRGAHAIAGLGIASFGPVDLDPSSATWGFITETPKPGWSQVDVARRIGAAIQLRPAFDTDVNGAALAEMRWGEGCGMSDFAYITVGTGVGVGLIVNGAPTRGFAHCELGHVRPARLPGDDWPGACPFHGDCIEGLASGTALKARAGSRPLSEIAEGDPFWTPGAWSLAQLCHVIVCAGAPRRIVIGGGVMERQPHLIARIDTILRESLAGYMPLPDDRFITQPGLGARAGQLGPIALALAGS